MSCGVGRRRGSDLSLLWLWRRPAAAAPIRPLAWEPPYAEGVTLKTRQKKKKKKEYVCVDAYVFVCVCLCMTESFCCTAETGKKL